MSEKEHTPDALLLMGSHCPWCPRVLEALKQLHADGAIASLETVNVDEHPDVAAELGVRTVPWVRIGPFELEGMRSATELHAWADKAGTTSGLADWLDELLSTGKFDKVEHYLQRDPALIDALLLLFENPDTKLNTRIGISAIMEGLEGTTQLSQKSDRLARLLKHPDASIRGDACHFLSLTGSPEAESLIQPLLDDPDADVRSVARDSLHHLLNNQPQ